MKILLFLILIFFICISNLYAQWEECNNGLGGTEVSCLIIDGNNAYAGIDGGVFITKNDGNLWTAKNNGLIKFIGLDIQSLAISGNNIFAGTIMEGIFLSKDKGDNWERKSYGLPYKANGQDTVYNATINSIIISGNNIFAGTNIGVFKSSDNGDNWIAKNNGITPFNTHILSLALSGYNIFICTDKGIFMTSDNGDNWKAKNNGLTNLEVYSIAISDGYIFAGSKSGIYLSTDNGDNWNFSGFKDTLYNSFTILGNNIFAGGYGLSLTTDNGISWTKYNTGSKTFSISCILINGKYFFVGTHNSGIYRAKLSDLGITDVKETEQKVENTIYPNPTSTEFQLKFEATSSTKTQISIFSLLGKELFSSYEDCVPGMNEKTIDCRSFDSGYYIVKVSSGARVRTQPLVIVK